MESRQSRRVTLRHLPATRPVAPVSPATPGPARRRKRRRGPAVAIDQRRIKTGANSSTGTDPETGRAQGLR
ncbi:hypothetical protein NP493_96g11002 [Ridgeia piscesae]|uniref:Uncharacterized protein n=1 Tax=Ridgeia piscesae TaxID=27915 RepID=A0AAD9UHR4_RIDPI|nr:hypothetical protein NP493_96g11002 [Ridgeia piscesae]